jgi:SAM-dependent methyltransferase
LRYHSILPYCSCKHVLDYGCGIGIGTNYLKPYCLSVTGYDVNRSALDEARALYPDIKFQDELNLNGINMCCLVEVLEHLEESESDSLLRNLRMNIVGTTPDGDWFKYHPKSLSERVGFHVLHYTYKELQELLNRFYPYVEIFGSCWDPLICKFTSYTFVGLIQV